MFPGCLSKARPEAAGGLQLSRLIMDITPIHRLSAQPRRQLSGTRSWDWKKSTGAPPPAEESEKWCVRVQCGSGEGGATPGRWSPWHGEERDCRHGKEWDSWNGKERDCCHCFHPEPPLREAVPSPPVLVPREQSLIPTWIHLRGIPENLSDPGMELPWVSRALECSGT